MTDTNKKRVMVVDALNLFIRCYIVNPSISTNGNPVGGIVGFLGSLRKLMRETKPDQVIICWDGPGGSQKRRESVKEYKQGRKPLRKNYEIEGMDEQSEKENKIWQQALLLEILNNMPMIQLMLPNVEADDIIAMVCRHHVYDGWQKVIVSSDKDFLQLMDEDTILFRPIQKKIHTWKNVIEDFGISAQNFVLARAIAGDKSDNLAGIPRAGLPTVAKRLSFLSETKDYNLDDIYDYCNSKLETKVKFYNHVVEGFDTVEKNYQIMNLVPPSISPQGREKINYAIENFEFGLNATELKRQSINNGFAHFDWSELIASMRRITNNNKSA